MVSGWRRNTCKYNILLRMQCRPTVNTVWFNLHCIVRFYELVVVVKFKDNSNNYGFYTFPHRNYTKSRPKIEAVNGTCQPLRQLLMWMFVKRKEDIYVAQDFIKQTRNMATRNRKLSKDLEMLNNRVNIVLQIRLCRDGFYGSSWSY